MTKTSGIGPRVPLSRRLRRRKGTCVKGPAKRTRSIDLQPVCWPDRASLRATLSMRARSAAMPALMFSRSNTSVVHRSGEQNCCHVPCPELKQLVPGRPSGAMLWQAIGAAWVRPSERRAPRLGVFHSDVINFLLSSRSVSSFCFLHVVEADDDESLGRCPI
jgi:hypothetical protein